MGNDIYMGGVRFTPDFDDMGAPQEQWYELSDGSGKGKVMVALAYQPSTVSSAFISRLSRCASVSVFHFRSVILPPFVFYYISIGPDSGLSFRGYPTLHTIHHVTAFRRVRSADTLFVELYRDP